VVAGPPLQPGKLHCWYADHQEVILPDGHRFPMDKYRATRQLLQSEAQTRAISAFYPSPAVAKEDLLRVCHVTITARPCCLRNPACMKCMFKVIHNFCTAPFRAREALCLRTQAHRSCGAMLPAVMLRRPVVPCRV
jgi:predicted metal-dependent hydrolase